MSDALNNSILTPQNQQTPVPSEAGLTPAYPGSVSHFPYGQTTADDENEFHAVAIRYIRLFLKHKWVIAGVVVAACALGLVTTMLKTPIYSAVTRIQIDLKPMKVIDGGTQQQNDNVSLDDLWTQYELLKSRSLAERVASNLHLANDPDFLAAHNRSALGFLKRLFRSSGETATPSQTSLQDLATTIVGDNIVIRPVPQSRLIDIIYNDSSADRAQRIVNAYAAAFIASNIDKRFEANSYAQTFLDDQIAQMKLRLDNSEQALIDYAEKEKVIDVNKVSITEDNLAAANTALGTIITERMKNEQSWQQMQNASDTNLPQFLSNNILSDLRSKRFDLQTEYNQKSAAFKPGYPAMIEISNQIAEIDRQIAGEVETIKSAAKASYEASVAQEQDMRQRLETLRADMVDSQKKGVRYKMLQDDVETNHSLYNSLLQRSKEVSVASGAETNNVFVVDRALTPDIPSEPNFTRSMLTFLAAGLASGIGLAMLLDKLNDRIYRAEDAEEFSGLRALGVIPTAPDDRDFREYLHDPHSAVAEAYRSLATALQFSTSTGTPRSLVVTSAGPAEGKSCTAFAIARHFAMTGLKVLLVDADMRKPSLSQFIKGEHSRGLSNYLVGTAEPPELLVQTEYPNLTFMPSGPIPPNAADILSGTRMFSLVSVAGEVFDMIVIDSPPMLALADAQLLAGTAAATLFVIAAGKQRKGMIRSTLRRLQMTHPNLLGLVLTNFDIRAAGYGYGYGYNYHYSYGNDDGSRSRTKTLTAAEAHPAEQLAQGGHVESS